MSLITSGLAGNSFSSTLYQVEQRVRQYGTKETGTVSDKLKHRLTLKATPKVLVERYLVEIAKNYNALHEPDSGVTAEAPLGQKKNLLMLESQWSWKREQRRRWFTAPVGRPVGTVPMLMPMFMPKPSPNTFLYALQISMECQWGLIRPFPVSIHLRYQPLPFHMNVLITLAVIRMSLQYPSQASAKPPPRPVLFFVLSEFPSVPDTLPTASSGGSTSASEDADFDYLSQRSGGLKKKT